MTSQGSLLALRVGGGKEVYLALCGGGEGMLSHTLLVPVPFGLCKLLNRLATQAPPSPGVDYLSLCQGSLFNFHFLPQPSTPSPCSTKAVGIGTVRIPPLPLTGGVTLS